jgi:hypothetical protein
VIINDVQAQKATADVKLESNHSKNELVVDEPQASRKDFEVKGVSPKSMNVWLKSMWSDFNRHIEHHPQHMIIAVGTTLAIVFAISIGLQPKQQERSYRNQFAQQTEQSSSPESLNNPSASHDVSFDIIKESQNKKSASTSLFDSDSHQKTSPSETEILMQKEQSRRKINLLLERASKNYRQGRLKDVRKAIGPHLSQGHPGINELMSNVNLLAAFMAKAEKMPCSRFMKEQVPHIHPGIIDHPMVQERIGHCKRVTPPDTL